MKENKNLDQTQVSKVTLHFVCSHLSRKHTVCGAPNLIEIEIIFGVVLYECKISKKVLGTGRDGQFGK